MKMDKNNFLTFRRKMSLRVPVLMILLEQGNNEKCTRFGVLKVTITRLFVQQYFSMCPLSQQLASL